MDVFQHAYPDHLAHCYGCGRLNEKGLHVETRWEGEESVTRFTPRPEHIALPGFVYGGLLASLIDCHGTGTAAAALAKAAGLDVAGLARFRTVTASLHVDYLRPTRLGPELVVRGRVVERSGRRVKVVCTVAVGDEVTAKGEVVAVQVPENFGVG